MITVLIFLLYQVLGRCYYHRANRCAMVYFHDDCQGPARHISRGQSSYVGHRWNDQVSSLVVQRGCKLEVYEDHHYRGRKRTFSEGQARRLHTAVPWWFNSFTWNNRISSWKCSCPQACNKRCDVCSPLLEYKNAADSCYGRITKAKNNAQDVKDNIDVMHFISQKAKSAQDTIAKIDRFMRHNSHIISKIPKVGRLAIQVTNSLKKFGDVMHIIGSKEPQLAKLKAGLKKGIRTLDVARNTVLLSRNIADRGRHVLKTSSSLACCSSIRVTASNKVLTSSAIRTATQVMHTCNRFNINVVLPSIKADLLNVIGAIADVVERVRKWIEDIRDAILRDANYFICCESFGRYLGDVAKVFSNLYGLVTCVGTGAMGGILDQSFDVLLKKLRPLFDGVNNQISKYNRFTREFGKSVRVKVLGFKTSSRSVQHQIRGCTVELPNINLFSSIDISADVTMPQLSGITFAFGDGQFNVKKVFGNIGAECEKAGKALVTLNKVDCCDIAQRYPDGTTCLMGTSCKACKNSATWWSGAFMTKCGREPCWGRGKHCGAGTTCNSCCSGADCDWWWAGVCKCK